MASCTKITKDKRHPSTSSRLAAFKSPLALAATWRNQRNWSESCATRAPNFPFFLPSLCSDLFIYSRLCWHRPPVSNNGEFSLKLFNERNEFFLLAQSTARRSSYSAKCFSGQGKHHEMKCQEINWTNEPLQTVARQMDGGWTRKDGRGRCGWNRTWGNRTVKVVFAHHACVFCGDSRTVILLGRPSLKKKWKVSPEKKNDFSREPSSAAAGDESCGSWLLITTRRYTHIFHANENTASHAQLRNKSAQILIFKSFFFQNNKRKIYEILWEDGGYFLNILFIFRQI